MRWVNPPDSSQGRHRNVYEDEAAELKLRPGQWGMLATFPVIRSTGKENNAGRGVANNIRRGKYVVFRPEGSFEARSVKEPDDTGRMVVNVYARYVGEPGG